jgi:DNA polymerase-4
MYDKLRGLEPYYVKNARSSLGHSHVMPPEKRNTAGVKVALHRLLQKALCACAVMIYSLQKFA